MIKRRSVKGKGRRWEGGAGNDGVRGRDGGTK